MTKLNKKAVLPVPGRTMPSVDENSPPPLTVTASSGMLKEAVPAKDGAGPSAKPSVIAQIRNQAVFLMRTDMV
jgi:hypothetical protein